MKVVLEKNDTHTHKPLQSDLSPHFRRSNRFSKREIMRRLSKFSNDLICQHDTDVFKNPIENNVNERGNDDCVSSTKKKISSSSSSPHIVFWCSRLNGDWQNSINETLPPPRPLEHRTLLQILRKSYVRMYFSIKSIDHSMRVLLYSLLSLSFSLIISPRIGVFSNIIRLYFSYVQVDGNSRDRRR